MRPVSQSSAMFGGGGVLDIARHLVLPELVHRRPAISDRELAFERPPDAQDRAFVEEPPVEAERMRHGEARALVLAALIEASPRQRERPARRRLAKA